MPKDFEINCHVATASEAIAKISETLPESGTNPPETTSRDRARMMLIAAVLDLKPREGGHSVRVTARYSTLPRISEGEAASKFFFEIALSAPLASPPESTEKK